jgi:hypothetical protein
MKSLMVGIIVSAAILCAGLTQDVRAEVRNAASPGTAMPLVDGAVQYNIEAIDSTKAEYVVAAAPVYHRTYTAFEFQSTNSALTYSAFGAALYATGIPGGGFGFKKALDLPDGAQIKRIDVYVIDNSATDDITVYLYKNTPGSGSGQTSLTQLSTYGFPTSPDVQTVSVTGNPIVTVDNSVSQYYLRYAPVITGQNHMLVGAHVEYTLPAIYLPSVVIK